MARSRVWERGRRTLFIDLGFLLTSGALSAICLSLLASERITIVPNALVVFLILFMQWEQLGVTVAKVGHDQIVFATVSRDQSIYYSLRDHFVKWILPVCGLFSLAVYKIFSPLAAIIIFLSIAMDTHSALVTADLAARKSFSPVSWGRLWNYPVFFLSTFVLALTVGLTIPAVLLLFLVGSAAQWAWLNAAARKQPRRRKVVLQGLRLVALQQVMNYLLFKVDQIVLSLAIFAGVVESSSSFTRYFVYSVKYPELVSAVVTTAGLALFPLIRVSYPASLSQVLRELRSVLPAIVAGIGLVVVSFLLYQIMWNGKDNWLIALPFMVHGLLSFPVNFATFSLLGSGHLQNLVRNLTISCALGAMLIFGAFVLSSPPLIAYVVGAQLLVFLVCLFVLPAGSSKLVYAIAHPPAQHLQRDVNE